MKKLFTLALLALSATAFSQTCYVDMVDSYNRVVRTFTAWGDPNTCLEAMKECRKSIRLDYSRNPRYPNGSLDCVRAVDNAPVPPTNPIPNPFPPTNPNPPTYPNPFPAPRQTDNIRPLIPQETVIYNNSYYTVVGTAYNGTVALKYKRSNTVIQGIRREEIAVTTGCNFDICINDEVVNVRTASDATIKGLTFNDGFVVVPTWNTMLSTLNYSEVAVTKGCTLGGYAQVCVGNQVLHTNGIYYEVVAIQPDNRVVLKSTWSNMLTVNVEALNLIVVR